MCILWQPSLFMLTFCLKGWQVRNLYTKVQHQKHSPWSGKAAGKCVPIGFSDSMNAHRFFQSLWCFSQWQNAIKNCGLWFNKLCDPDRDPNHFSRKTKPSSWKCCKEELCRHFQSHFFTPLPKIMMQNLVLLKYIDIFLKLIEELD